MKLSLRITAAGLLAFAVAHLLGLQQGYWAVLTAVIVMQASVGGALKAMLDRLVATIGGAAWGVAAAIAIPHAGVVSTGLALTVALVPLAVLVAFRPAYRVAPVTAVIVVLILPGPAASVFASGVSRVWEIALGTVVALAVALLVSPSRAHALLLQAARDVLDLIGEQIVLLLGEGASDAGAAAMQSFHDRVRGALERAAAMSEEAARERASHVADSPDPEPLVRALRRLYHDLVMIGRASLAALPEPMRSRLAEPAAAFAAAIAAFLTATGDALATGALPPSPDAVVQALAGYEAAMAEARRDGLTRALSDDDVGRVFGLAFALAQLRRDLDDVGNRTRELAHASPRPNAAALAEPGEAPRGR